MGNWAMGEVCRRRQLVGPGALETVTVNVSSVQLAER